MLHEREKRCEDCNGWGIFWNEAFDRKVDQYMDTQGLSMYESVLFLKKSPTYKEDYWNCDVCKGTGEKSSE